MSDSELRPDRSGDEPRLGGAGERLSRQEPSLGGVSLLTQALEGFHNPDLSFTERHRSLVYARKTLDRIKNQKIAVPSSFDLDAYVAELAAEVRQVVLNIPSQLPAWADQEGEGDYGVWDFCTAAIAALGEYGDPQDEEARGVLFSLLQSDFSPPLSREYWLRRWPDLHRVSEDPTSPLSFSVAEAICRLANPADIPTMIDLSLGRGYYSQLDLRSGYSQLGQWLQDRYLLKLHIRHNLHLFGEPIIVYLTPLLRKLGPFDARSPANDAEVVLELLGEVAIPELLKATRFEYHHDDSEAMISQPDSPGAAIYEMTSYVNDVSFGVKNALLALMWTKVRSPDISERMAQIAFEDKEFKGEKQRDLRLMALRALGVQADIRYVQELMNLTQEAIAADDSKLTRDSMNALRAVLEEGAEIGFLERELDRCLALLQGEKRGDSLTRDRAELILRLLIQLKHFDVVERVYSGDHKAVVVTAAQSLLNYDQEAFDLTLSQPERDRMFEILRENCAEWYFWVSHFRNGNAPYNYSQYLQSISRTAVPEAYSFLSNRLTDNQFHPISREPDDYLHGDVTRRNETVMAVYAGLSQLKDPRVIEAYIGYFDYIANRRVLTSREEEVYEDFWRRTTDSLAGYARIFFHRIDWEKDISADELRPTLTRLRALEERLSSFADRFYPDLEDDDEDGDWEVVQISDEVVRWQMAVQDATQDIEYWLMI